MKLLILLVVVIGVVALIQMARVYELTSKLRGKREEDISNADNRMNAAFMIIFMILFYASTIVLYVRYGNYLPPSASEHGVGVDALMSFNLVLITIVFFVVNTLLFAFAAKYYYKKERKAKFFAHDNRLELIWTVIPSIVLAVIIIYGLNTWNKMTGEASDDAIIVELYSKQFDWTARYPGANNEFGLSNFNLISTNNPLGIVTPEALGESIESIDADIKKLEDELSYERGVLVDQRTIWEDRLDHLKHHDHHDPHHHHIEFSEAEIKAELAKLEKMLDSDKVSILTEAALEAKQEKVYRLKRHKQRILDIENFDFEGTSETAWEAGKDDKIVKGEFHLPVGKEVEFVFRSRDVIHSAYMPHFRTQMNTVPGIPTRFKMTPIITTDSMRMVLDDPEFDYVLLCNKVCGAAHFNMQMKVIVETEEQYNEWLKSQETFVAEEKSEAEEEAIGSSEVEVIEDAISASLK
ncbi:MAG: cytochrome c oxidase subunit II [Flavobacteriales bacterium]